MDIFLLKAINTVDVVYIRGWDTTSRISKEAGAGRSSYRYMTWDTLQQQARFTATQNRVTMLNRYHNEKTHVSGKPSAAF